MNVYVDIMTRPKYDTSLVTRSYDRGFPKGRWGVLWSCRAPGRSNRAWGGTSGAVVDGKRVCGRSR